MGQEALVGLPSADWYLMIWRTRCGLGSSHHGAGEKSLTKRTHMSAPLRLDEKESRKARTAAGRRTGKLAAASHRKPRSRKMAWQLDRGDVSWSHRCERKPIEVALAFYAPASARVTSRDESFLKIATPFSWFVEPWFRRRNKSEGQFGP